MSHVSHADARQSTGSQDGISIFITEMVPFNLDTVYQWQIEWDTD